MLLLAVAPVAALQVAQPQPRGATPRDGATPRAAPPRMLLTRMPPEIRAIATPDWRWKEQSCSESEVAAMWGAFVRVYGSQEKALAASRKNQAVILPYLCARPSPRRTRAPPPAHDHNLSARAC